MTARSRQIIIAGARHCRADGRTGLCRSAAFRCSSSSARSSSSRPAPASSFRPTRRGMLDRLGVLRRAAAGGGAPGRGGAARRAQALPNWPGCRSAMPPNSAGGRPISSPTAPTCRARCMARVAARARDPNSSPARRSATSRCTAHGVTVSIDRGGKRRRSDGPAAGRRRRRLVEHARPCRRQGQEPLFRAASPGAPAIRADGRPATSSPA